MTRSVLPSPPTLALLASLVAGAGVVTAACSSLKDANADAPDGGGDDASSDGAPGPDDDGGPGASEGGSDGAASDAGGDGSGPGGTGNGDPRWVQGKVPVDAPPATGFTISNTADGALVTDTLTGLTWQDTIPGSTTNYALAQSYCAGLTYGGSGGWRIPTRWEMISLLALSTTFDDSSLTPAAFSASSAAQYNHWTQSTYAPSPADTVWTINVAGTQPSPKTDKAAVRCVRAAALPAPKAPLYDLSDVEIVRDLTTGLYWERTPAGTTSTLAAADARCKLVTLQGRNARLPTVKELASLVDETAYQPALAGALGAYPVRMFTTNPVWSVDFASGSLIQGPSGQAMRARCVADP